MKTLEIINKLQISKSIFCVIIDGLGRMTKREAIDFLNIRENRNITWEVQEGSETMVLTSL